MGKRAASGAAATAVGNGPRNNLSEQREWVKQRPVNALQQCLNSHAINKYLDSRAARKEAAMSGSSVDTAVDVDATIKRGASAMQVFRRFSALATGGLQVLPLPKPTVVTPPPLVPFVGDDGAMVTDGDDENAPVTDRGNDRPPHASTSSYAGPTASTYTRPQQSATLNPAPQPNRRAQAVVQRPSSPSPAMELDVEDDFFDDVDIEALIASRARPDPPVRRATEAPPAQQQDFHYTPPSRVNNSDLSRDYSSNNNSNANNSFSSPPQRSSPPGRTPERVREEIHATREALRRVRENCDDASLEGEIPAHLTAARGNLERKLENLSREYRDLKAGASAPPASSSGPQQYTTPPPTRAPTPTHHDDSTGTKCSCGMTTTQAKVQHGQNADRLYNRCSSCGFHSWADEGETTTSRQANYSEFPSAEAVVSSDAGVREKMLRAKRVLRDVFGHNAFRPNQERVVMEAFSRRDVFVLMPTGGGKSLCYQLPACIDEGVTIVISPLVSLIQDQVQQLEALDVGVAHLNGDQDDETVQKPIISELFSNRIRIKLLYVTPEKIAGSNQLNNIFESLERRGLLARFVVDEAHCISQWGHDFRKDYMQLGQLRSKFKSVPIMALTATANNQTEADIAKNLHLSSPFVTKSSFNRHNLTYDVRKKSPKFLDEIASFVRQHSDESGIIYCLSKKDCEQVSEKLIKALGFEGTRKANTISFYHAGLESEDRAHRHHEWSKGKIKLIVATVAFGMGINKPDVRYVIHHTIPQSVTHYYQEAGRAGRDGDVANCILYYSYADLTRRRQLIMKDADNRHHVNVHLQHLRRMAEFCENQVECRRTTLLEYFGEHFSRQKCRETCDNCKNRAQGLVAEPMDVTEDCTTLIDTMKQLQADNESITLTQFSQIYLGQTIKGKERKRDQFAKLQGYGAGKSRFSKSEIERILYHMIMRDYLREIDKTNTMGFTTTFLAVGYKADRVARGERVRIVVKTHYEKRKGPSPPNKSKESSAQASKTKEVSKKPSAKKKPARKPKPHADAVEELSDEFDDDVVEVLPPPSKEKYPLIPQAKTAGRIPLPHVEALAQLLKDWRGLVCDNNNNLMPYHILPTSGIAAIANAVPVTNAELMEIEGVGRIRVKKYGDSIINIVQAYLSKHKLTPTPAPKAANTAGDALSGAGDVEAPSASPFFKQKSSARDEFDEDDIDWAALDEDIFVQSSITAKRKSDGDSTSGSSASKRQK